MSFVVQVGHSLPLSAAAGVQSLHSSTSQQGGSENATGKSWSKAFTVAGAAGVAGGLGYVLAEEESEHGLHAPQYPWSHAGWFSAYDHASIRRGHQVYTQVCAACHSVEQLHYRNLIGVAYTEDEVKEMAAEVRTLPVRALHASYEERRSSKQCIKSGLQNEELAPLAAHGHSSMARFA